VVVNEGQISFSGTPREVFSHAAELENMGLGLPSVTRIFHRLKELGSDVDPSVFTMDQAIAAVLGKLERGRV